MILKNNSNYNIFFLAAVVEKYRDMFAEDGCVKLNRMITERTVFTGEQAFGLIADCLESGLIYIDKMNKKRLVLNTSIYESWRDVFIEGLAAMHAKVASNSWGLKPVERPLSAKEKAMLNKHVRMGKLKASPRQVDDESRKGRIDWTKINF